MNNIGALETALDNLSDSIQNFSVGAITLDDVRPVDDKIRNIKESVQHLNSPIIALNVQDELQTTTEVPKKGMKETCSKLYECTAQSIINRKALELCLHNNTLSDILSRQEFPEMEEKICEYLNKMCTFNDILTKLHASIQEAFKKQLRLKIECQKAIFDYNTFLKEQHAKRQEKLKETNPEVVKNKEKMLKSVQKINIIKRLITNLIASSGKLLKEKPFLEEMLEKHAELVNEETIIKLAENDSVS